MLGTGILVDVKERAALGAYLVGGWVRWDTWIMVEIRREIHGDIWSSSICVFESFAQHEMQAAYINIFSKSLLMSLFCRGMYIRSWV